jgi:nucleoside-diphosphate-sugar epimerase
MKVLITGAAGTAGQAVAKVLRETTSHQVRLADVTAPPEATRQLGEFVRCDTRTASDVDAAVAGTDAVIHLAAWHCAHKPPVSDDTIFDVNVDGTYNVIQSAKKHGVKSLVFASSMAYGHGGVYGVTKVLGEDLCKCFYHMTQTPTVCLRYHDFVPKPYLAFGNVLLRHGVDRRDVATATVASLEAGLARKVSWLVTVVHHRLGCPPDVISNFAKLGPDWLEQQMPGAKKLIEKYGIEIPNQLEQHDMSEAARLMGWKPSFNILNFLRDLQARDARGEDVKKIWASGEVPS